MGFLQFLEKCVHEMQSNGSEDHIFGSLMADRVGSSDFHDIVGQVDKLKIVFNKDLYYLSDEIVLLGVSW